MPFSFVKRVRDPVFSVPGPPALSQIVPDASAVRPPEANSGDNGVWPCAPGRIPQPKRFCVKRFGVS